MNRKFQKLLLLFLLLPLFCLPAGADAGPKPSVTVTLEGLEGRPCWGTLLSQVSSTGPYSALEGRELTDSDPGEAAALQAFLSLDAEDTEGFYVLNYVQDCSDGTFSWTYYPPGVFKLALWFPEEDALLVGPMEKRYAFDSYYTLDLSQTAPEPGKVVQAEELPKSYPYGQELLALAGRVLLTWAVELALAWLLGFRARGQLAWIAGVNLATQGLLNLGLNVFTYFCGALMGMTVIFVLPVYLLLEAAIALTELAVYRRVLPSRGPSSPRRITAYAWLANLASCAAGVALSFPLGQMF